MEAREGERGRGRREVVAESVGRKERHGNTEKVKRIVCSVKKS